MTLDSKVQKENKNDEEKDEKKVSVAGKSVHNPQRKQSGDHYDKKASFFDNISCNRLAQEQWYFSLYKLLHITVLKAPNP